MTVVFAGRYELLDLIQQREQAEIFRAWDLRDEQYQAVKVLDQVAAAPILRFIHDESFKFAHPQALIPKSWVGEGEKVVIPLPLIAGQSLAEVLRSQRVTWSWMRSLLKQVLDVLKVAHDAGVIHRNLEPEAILITSGTSTTPEVFVGGFGGVPRGDVESGAFRSAAALFGDPPHPSDDIYSLGAIVLSAFGAQGSIGRLASRWMGHSDPIVSVDAALASLNSVAMEEESRPVTIEDSLPAFPAGWGPQGPKDESSFADVVTVEPTTPAELLANETEEPATVWADSDEAAARIEMSNVRQFPATEVPIEERRGHPSMIGRQFPSDQPQPSTAPSNDPSPELDIQPHEVPPNENHDEIFVTDDEKRSRHWEWWILATLLVIGGAAVVWLYLAR